MDHLFDEAARILAGPMPRRKALERLGRVLVAGLLGAFGSTHLAAQTMCGSRTCNRNQICCRTTGFQPFCTNLDRTCCGNTSCNRNTEACCVSGSQRFCINRNRTCCGTTSCNQNQSCCGGVTCCNQNQRCVNGRCQVSRADADGDGD
jgi:hypothetical protein